MGQFDSVDELAEHFKCMPILGSESGKCEHSYINIEREVTFFLKEKIMKPQILVL